MKIIGKFMVVLSMTYLRIIFPRTLSTNSLQVNIDINKEIHEIASLGDCQEM